MKAPQANIHFNLIRRSNGSSAVAAAAYRSGESLELDGKRVGISKHEAQEKTQSVVGAAAYRSGEALEQEDVQRFDYTRKTNILHVEIIAPDEAPDWVHDRQSLWNAVEQNEKRKDSQLAREAQLKLPRGLTHEQHVSLVRSFVRDTFVSRGMVADLAFHDTPASDGGRNPHCHVMLTMRGVNADGWEHYKDGGKHQPWNKKARISEWRMTFQDYVNAAFEDAGMEDRVDLRSYKEKGLDKEPQPKLGPNVAAMERDGVRTTRGDALRRTQHRNAMVAYYESMRKQPWARDGDRIHNTGWHGVNVAVASSQSTMKEAGQRHQDVQQRLEQQHAQKMASEQRRMMEIAQRNALRQQQLARVQAQQRQIGRGRGMRPRL